LYTLLGIPIANWIDHGVNRVRLTACLTALWSAMTIMCGLAGNFGHFLVARMGVGLAEAGFTPMAHSFVADLYVQRERPRAMGIFALGLPIGMMAGLSIGGVVAQMTGWRTALFVAGAPGLLAALLFAFLAHDPARGATDDRGDGEKRAPLTYTFLQTVRELARRPAFVQVVLASAASSFAQVGLSSWLPSFLIRTHGLSLSQVGLALGVLLGIGGMAGTAFGGWQATRLGDRGLQWTIRVPTIALAVCIPLYIAALLAGSSQVAFLMLVPATFLSTMWTAPSIALAQSLAPAEMRARASAICIVASNLIGVSLGPVAVGLLSDWFGALRGDASAGLRDALVVITLMLLWGLTHWILLARALSRTARHGSAPHGQTIANH
jgi:predicted MFS family arabinose efflux permease